MGSHWVIPRGSSTVLTGPNGFYDAVNFNRTILYNDALCSLANDYHDDKQCNSSPTITVNTV
ncbi:uncharacterized protein [Physcomitrium patens]|uniref:uncharacterized protein isoform X10 n=1 Tax=Physcomitrium patens TaxID=3218 RepID=UPI003CCE1B16